MDGVTCLRPIGSVFRHRVPDDMTSTNVPTTSWITYRIVGHVQVVTPAGVRWAEEVETVGIVMGTDAGEVANG